MCGWIAVLLALSAFACEDPASPPGVCAPIDDLSVYIGEAAETVACFADEDQGTLDYAVRSSNPSIATVAVIPPGIDDLRLVEVHVRALAVGEATITLTAANAGGESADAVFRLTVPNRDPEYCGLQLSPVALPAGDTVYIPICFTDPDKHALSYSVATSTDAVTVSVDSLEVRVEATGRFHAEITVTATDTEGGSGSIVFDTEVPNHAPVFCKPLPSSSYIEMGSTRVFEVCVSDPDRDMLIDSLVVDGDLEVALVAGGDSLSITAGAEGVSVVEYWISDPYGEVAVSIMRVVVGTAEIILRDHFDENTGWDTALSDAGDSNTGTFSISDGVLETWWEYPGLSGRGGASREVIAEDWAVQIRARLRKTSIGIWVNLWSDDGLRAYQAIIIPELIMAFGLCEYSSTTKRCEPGAHYIITEHMPRASDQWFELEISVQSGEDVIFMLDGEERYRSTSPDAVLQQIKRVSLMATLTQPEDNEVPAEYDYIIVHGRRTQGAKR